MSTKEIGKSIVLKDCVLGYAQSLYHPKVIVTGEPKYSVMAIFGPKSEAANLLKETVADLISKRWPAGEPERLRKPWKWGPRFNDYRESTGKSRIPELDKDGGQACCSPWASKSEPPGLYDIYGQELTQQGDVYSGAPAHVSVRLYTYNKSEDNRGVGMQLEYVLKTGEGERVGGRRSVMEALGSLFSKEAPPSRENVAERLASMGMFEDGPGEDDSPPAFKRPASPLGPGGEDDSPF